MSFMENVDGLFDLWNQWKKGVAIGQLIGLDRCEAMQALAYVVHQYTPQELNRFEALYLNASMGMLSPAQRIRAMELYAGFKWLEGQHYGEWQGFSTPQDPL